MKNLQVIENDDIAVIDYNVTNEALAELKKKYTGLAVSSNKERDIVQSGITELTRLRTSVEKKRKELKADALEHGRKVDAEAKRVTELIEDIEQPLKDAKQAYDDEKERVRLEEVAKEQHRIKIITDRIVDIKNDPLNYTKCGSHVISDRITRFKHIYRPNDFNYQEFSAEAESAIAETLTKLQEMFVDRQEFEAEQDAQIERQKEADSARLKFESEQAALRAEQRAFEEKQAAARHAEESRIAAAQKAERDAEHARRQEELKRQQEENARLAKIKEDELAIERQKLQLEKEKAEHEAKIVRDDTDRKAKEADLITKAAPYMLDALIEIEKFLSESEGDDGHYCQIARSAINRTKA